MAKNELAIGSMDELARFSAMIARAGYFGMTAEQAAVKILAGHELGIGPLQALMNVHVIPGDDGKMKITLAAGLVAALIKGSGRYDYTVSETTDKRCCLAFWTILPDGGRRQDGEAEFTIDEAKRANLLVSRKGKPKKNWSEYPADMLFARALTRGARRFCPDVFQGPIYTTEEIDTDDGAGIPDMQVPNEPDLGQSDEPGGQDPVREQLLEDLITLRSGQTVDWITNEIKSDPVGRNSWFGDGVRWMDGALDEPDNKAVRQRFHIWVKEAAVAYDDVRQWPLYAIKAQGVINLNRALREIDAKRKTEAKLDPEDVEEEAADQPAPLPDEEGPAGDGPASEGVH